MTTREKLMKLLADKYNDMFLRTTEEFDGSTSGIWSSGETYLEAKDGFNLFDYYTENYKRYEFGVHNELVDFLDKHGWYAEWHDPGTIMFYPA
jgi:hypothetical protein